MTEILLTWSRSSGSRLALLCWDFLGGNGLQGLGVTSPTQLVRRMSYALGSSRVYLNEVIWVRSWFFKGQFKVRFEMIRKALLYNFPKLDTLVKIHATGQLEYRASIHDRFQYAGWVQCWDQLDLESQTIDSITNQKCESETKDKGLGLTGIVKILQLCRVLE